MIPASSDLTRPFQVEFKVRPLPDITINAGDWAFRGRVSGSTLLYFGPDPAVAASLAQRGGQAIVRAVARGGAASGGLFFTELGTVTTVGAVAVGVGTAAAAVTWLGFVLYQIGESHKRGRWLAACSEFAEGYGHMLMELTASEKIVGKFSKDKVARYLSIDWKAEFKKRAKQWIDDEDRGALNQIYYFGEAAAASDYDTYVRLYGDEQWRKLAAAHRQKYGEDFQRRQNRYWNIVRQQLKDRKSPVGIPLEVNPCARLNR